MSIITKTSDFENDQVDKKFTLPNMLSVARGVGGITLGALMAKYPGVSVDTLTAAGTATAFAASDAEGSLIKVARNWPNKVKDTLKIWPSTYGVRWDVYGDKAFMLSLLGGGVAGGYIPVISLSLLVPEVSTAVTSLYAGRKMDKEPDVSAVGKVGMIARFAEIGAYLTAYTLKDKAPMASEVLTNTGYAMTASAFVLGFMSCYNVYKQGQDLPEIVSPAVNIIRQTNGPNQLAVAV